MAKQRKVTSRLWRDRDLLGRWQPLFGTFEKALGLLGLVVLCGLIVLALFPVAFAPYDPTALVGRPLERPGRQFLLGTNDIGQDILSELIWSTRNSLLTGLSVAVLSVILGGAVGMVSGSTRGTLGDLLMRLVDLTLAFPLLPLVILLSAYVGSSQVNIIVILTLVSWAIPARLIRAQVLTILTEPYIEAARTVGCTYGRLLWTHIQPGIRGLALVQLILVASASILAEASLSFLGLGNPSAKSWGTMLYFARASGAFLGDAWRWWVLPAGLLITLTVLSLVLIGFSLERIIEPGLRR